MSNPTRAITYMPGVMDSMSRNIYLPFTVSVVCHLIFLAVLIFVPGLNMPRRISHSVIRVNMVTLPAKGSSFKARSRVISKQTVTDKKKSADGVSFKKITAAPKKKDKTEKTPPKDVKSAIERIKDEAETSRPKEVTDAIARIRDHVEVTDANRTSVQNDDEELLGVESGSPYGSGVGGESSLDILEIYKYAIADLVEKNWAYSESLADAKPDLQTSLVFEVLPNGEIRDIWFTEKSGNKYLDESAYKAVMKSKPFPPHPKELSRPMVTVPLRFTPKGLQR